MIPVVRMASSLPEAPDLPELISSPVVRHDEADITPHNAANPNPGGLPIHTGNRWLDPAACFSTQHPFSA